MRLLPLGDRVVDLDAGVVDAPTGVQALAPLEVALLRYLADRPGRAVSRDDLQVDVWGISRAALTRSIDVTVSRLRRKIEADPVNPVFLVTLHGSGYRLELPPPAPSPAGPPSAGALVGRARERAAVGALAGAERLVTLLGPAGVGKTRLAAAVARDAPRAVWCALGGARDADGVASALAAGLGVGLRDADPLGQLARAAASLGPCLVVLDEVEAVRAEVAAVAASWSAAPGARLLATSRVALGAPGEVVWPLEPLPEDDGVALFTERVRQRDARAALEPGEVARLVRALDGLPLAIELAAARTRTLTVAELLARPDRFAALGGGAPGTPHETLWAALDGSWAPLPGPVRRALAALAAIDGTFDTAAAEAVLAAPGALDVLGTLVDHSLLQRERGRWRVLAAVRAFVAERSEPGLLAAAELRLADHLIRRYGAVLELPSPPHDLREALAADLPALTRALHDAVRRGDGGRAAALLAPASTALLGSGPLAAARGLTRSVLAMPLSPAELVVPALVRTLLAAEGAWEDGDPTTHAATAVALAREAGSPALRVRAGCAWGRALGRQGLVDEGRRALEEAVAVARKAGLAAWEGAALTYLGWHHATDGGDLDAARVHLELALGRAAGGGAPVGLAHAGLARVATSERRFAVAARELDRAVAACVADGADSQLVALRYNVANNLLQGGRAEQAAAAAREALDGARRTGSAVWSASAAKVLATALVAAGRADEVAALDLPALAAPVPAGAAADLWHRLGAARLVSGELEAARDAFSTSLGLAPNVRFRLQAEVGLACVEACQGRVERAEARLERLRRLGPSGPDVDRLVAEAEVRVAAARGDDGAVVAIVDRWEAEDEAVGGRLAAPLRALRDQALTRRRPGSDPRTSGPGRTP